MTQEVKPQDHPDFVGGWIWTKLEIRWIEERIAKAVLDEREALAQRTWVGSGDLEDSNAYLIPPQTQEPVESLCCPVGKCAYRSVHKEENCPRENVLKESPQRTWVDLTDEQIEASKPPLSNDAVVWELAVEWAQAQLKEKNT